MRFKEYNLNQAFLLSPSMKEWLPEKDLACFLIDLVAELDLSEIYKHYYRGGRQGKGKQRAAAV